MTKTCFKCCIKLPLFVPMPCFDAYYSPLDYNSKFPTAYLLALNQI